jgi:putative GTP pyrophosphokinase
MASEISKTQIDPLGERLKKGNITEADLRLLDSYRRSFTEAYEIVVGRIRKELELEPTGRPAKSTTSISDKLRRESIRLTQIQDIAGCRLIVADIANQETVVDSLKNLFEQTTIVDRREQPSHGYRAVHVIARCNDKMIEIQVRTALQQLWAELSEKYSDVIDPAIKYGGGGESIQISLREMSDHVAKCELLEIEVAHLLEEIITEGLPDAVKQSALEAQQSTNIARQAALNYLRYAIEHPEEVKGEKDALSD